MNLSENYPCATKRNEWDRPEKKRTTINLSSWLNETVSLLGSRSTTPQLEAQVLAAFTLNTTRPWVIAHGEYFLKNEEIKWLDACRHRLLLGEPLPYITGTQSFYGIDFSVDKNVLIPRPETELLVEEAIKWGQNLPKTNMRICDVGVGSGCITISLGAHWPDAYFTAIDRSPRALHIARHNAHKIIPATPIDWICCDLLTGVKSSFDLICANLPYIPSEMVGRLPVSAYEPRLALDGGEDGMRLIVRLLDQIDQRLIPGGLALFEIEENQAENVRSEAKIRYPHAKIEIKTDLAGKTRLLKLENVKGHAH